MDAKNERDCMNKKIVQRVSFGLVMIGLMFILSGVLVKFFKTSIPFPISTWVVVGLVVSGLILIIGSVFWAEDAMND